MAADIDNTAAKIKQSGKRKLTRSVRYFSGPVLDISNCGECMYLA